MVRALFSTAILVPLALAGCGSENAISNKRQVDVWYQSSNDQVDILFVVDDSNSMQEEQEALAEGFRSFVTEISDANSDFHLGVTTTSMDPDDPTGGALRGTPTYLTPDDDFVQGMKDRVLVGTNGSDQERGLQAAAWAVSPEMQLTANSGFIRYEAHLLIVIVSDEEDCSDDGRLAGQPGLACYENEDELNPVEDYVEQLEWMKPDPEMVLVGAIIGPNGGGCQDSYPGFRYARTVVETGGLVGNICDPDWSDMLYDLGLDAAGILTDFKLSRGAKPETLEVFIDGVTLNEDPLNGWTYDDTTWRLSFHGAGIPARESEIEASYEVLPGYDPEI